MARSPRYEIPVYRNFPAGRIEKQYARQQPNESKQSASYKRENPPASTQSRGAATAAILIGEVLFLTIFIGIVTVWNLTDIQSAIVAVSLASTIVLLVRVWCPKWVKLLAELRKVIPILKG